MWRVWFWVLELLSGDSHLPIAAVPGNLKPLASESACSRVHIPIHIIKNKVSICSLAYSLKLVFSSSIAICASLGSEEVRENEVDVSLH